MSKRLGGKRGMEPWKCECEREMRVNGNGTQCKDTVDAGGGEYPPAELGSITRWLRYGRKARENEGKENGREEGREPASKAYLYGIPEDVNTAK